MRYTLLFIFFLFINESIAQELMGWEDVRISPDKKDTIDYSEINVHYRQSVRNDTTFPDRIRVNEMFLQIGKDISKYADYNYFRNDSIYETEYYSDMSNQELAKNVMTRARTRTDFLYIYKKMPDKLYVHDRAVSDRYYYVEDIPYFGWELKTDTISILGFLCNKAVCRFRGREYAAWYTPNIPVNNGPWKFCGLPGLILKVTDSKGDYDFECTAFYKVYWKQPIYKNERKEYKTTREKFLVIKQANMANSAFMLEHSGKVVSAGGEAPVKSLPYNPIELE